MTKTIVRYRVKPDRVEENAALVRDVYAELAERRPEGFRYATFLLEDGASFVHIAFSESAPPPLPELGAFKRFQAEIGERCEEGPVAMSAEEIGSFGFYKE